MKLFSSQQVYELDGLAIERDKQPAKMLMQKAANATWRHTVLRWPEARDIVVFAGPGNNGGDAFAVALLARQDGYNVRLIAIGDLSRQSAESAHYRERWQAAGGQIEAWTGTIPHCDVIIDGLLGIGLNKPLDVELITVLQAINSYSAKRVSIDIPSGLKADSGMALPVAVQADLTVSFIGRKVGCYVADGPDICGERVFDDLGLSASSLAVLKPMVTVLDSGNLPLPAPRKQNGHKYNFGHVLVVGGQVSMSGAVRLAGMAALRCGAGVVSLCVHPDNVQITASQHPELMVDSWENLPELVSKASVLAIGPGLGRTAEAISVLQQLKQLEIPMVIDADALDAPFISSLATRDVVLTPHPGEAARLLNMTSSQVQQDRIGALQQLTRQWDFVSVLKGSGTLIGHASHPFMLCDRGHPGMATAGMGDVLTGMVAGYLAQGLDAISAAQTAVFIHAAAAEDFASQGDADCLIASDIINGIASAVQSIRQSGGE